MRFFRMRFRAPGSLNGSFVGVGSELARGRSSVEEAKSGREILRGSEFTFPDIRVGIGFLVAGGRALVVLGYA